MPSSAYKIYPPACKSSGGSRPPKPSGYAPVSRPEQPSSATAGNGFSALRGSRVSSTSATLPAPTVPPPDTPPSAGQTPCSPMSKTASWPPTAPSRPNICRATSAPSPGASTAASSSRQSTSDWPSPPRRPRQCPIASSNWLRLDGKRDRNYLWRRIGGSEWGWRCGSGEPEGALLGTPLGRQIDIANEPVRGQFGRLTSRRDRLDDLRCQEGKRQQAAYVAIT